MPLGGAGLASAIGYGITGGMAAGAAEQLTFNLLSPCAVWHENLLQSMLVGGAAGGVFGGVGYGFNKLITTQRLNLLIKRAREQYPNLANQFHRHHIYPKYIWKELKLPVREQTVKINAAYHQVITNAIREEFPFGVGDVLRYHKTLDAVEKVLKQIYRRYLLP